MERVYSIADIKIKLESPFKSYDENNIKLFVDNYIGKCDINYKIIEKNYSEIKEDEILIYESSEFKVYSSGKGMIWRYKYIYTNNDYCCLVENEDKERKIYIYENIEKYFPHTSAIFTKLNIHGALLSKEVMILHSSFIIHNNQSILFTAPSGTGKSTQASLWEKYKGAEIINGDRSAIGTRNGEYFAYGLPFCGSSNICKNKEAPLKAIVVLKQAKENSVRRLSKIEAFKILLGQVAINRWNKKDMELAMTLIEELIEKVPVVTLSCRPDKEATDVLNDYLNNEI